MYLNFSMVYYFGGDDSWTGRRTEKRVDYGRNLIIIYDALVERFGTL